MDTKYILSIGIAWVFLSVIIGNILLAMPSDDAPDVIIKKVYMYDDPANKAHSDDPEQATSEVCIETSNNDCEGDGSESAPMGDDVSTQVNITN